MAASESTPSKEKFKVCGSDRAASPFMTMPSVSSAANASSLIAWHRAARWVCSPSASVDASPKTTDQRDRQRAWPETSFLTTAVHEWLERRRRPASVDEAAVDQAGEHQ
jgi:hypothetical protein